MVLFLLAYPYFYVDLLSFNVCLSCLARSPPGAIESPRCILFGKRYNSGRSWIRVTGNRGGEVLISMNRHRHQYVLENRVHRMCLRCHPIYYGRQTCCIMDVRLVDAPVEVT